VSDLRIVTTVCTGNLCRSAIAQTLLAKHLDAKGITDVVVQSAGTAARDGQPTIEAAKRAAASLGGDLSHHRTTNLDRATVDESIYLLCAAGEHRDEILERWPDVDPGKVRLFAEAIADDAPEDIEDPYDFDQAMFHLIARVIDASMEAWADKLVRSPWKD